MFEMLLTVSFLSLLLYYKYAHITTPHNPSRTHPFRSTVAPNMDPVIVILIEKLSDGNVRIREGARKGLEVLAGERECRM
jgi:hypothetical protein